MSVSPQKPAVRADNLLSGNPAFDSPPTRTRYSVLTLLGLLAFVLYIDRVCIGQAKLAIQEDLKLTETQFGYALGAFTIAYGLFEVPSGRWGDRFGSRGVLARIVLWWSLFTALTGAVFGLYSLVAVRFLFGAGEAGAYPNVARIISRWFPRGERGRAQGVVITCAQVGGAVAPIITGWTIYVFGWRWTFFVFSLLGVAWAALFYRLFRDDPAQHPGTNAAERALIAADSATLSHESEHPPIPWRAILSNSNIWLLGTVQTCSSFLSYMFMGWYPSYLVTGRGVEKLHSSPMTSLVMGGAVLGCLLSGFLNDYLARATGFNPVRFRIYGFAGTALSAVALVISVQCADPWATSLWASIAFMACISQQATFWAVTTEIGGAHLGVVFGLLNSMGVIGATLSSVFVGQFVDEMKTRGFTGREAWDPVFYVYAGILVVGALCWLFVDARKHVPDRDE